MLEKLIFWESLAAINTFHLPKGELLLNRLTCFPKPPVLGQVTELSAEEPGPLRARRQGGMGWKRQILGPQDAQGALVVRPPTKHEML